MTDSELWSSPPTCMIMASLCAAVMTKVRRNRGDFVQFLCKRLLEMDSLSSVEVWTLVNQRHSRANGNPEFSPRKRGSGPLSSPRGKTGSSLVPGLRRENIWIPAPVFQRAKFTPAKAGAGMTARKLPVIWC